MLQMFSHGIMTALFFALVGAIYDRAHVRDIGILEGLTKRMGLTSAFFAVAGLTSLGLPGLSGFVAELMVFIGLFREYPIIGMLGIIGAAITAVYILRLLGKVFFGPISPQWQHLTDATRLEGFSMAILVAFLVGVGTVPPALDGPDQQRRCAPAGKGGGAVMNFMLFLPEFLVTGVAFGVLGIDLFLSRERKSYLPWITLVGLVAVFACR